MLNVTVVTAFIPLSVKHLSVDQYKEFGARLKRACGERMCAFEGYDLSACWLTTHPELVWKPATETPADRYSSPEEHIRSHIIQHSRTQWALKALEERPQTEVVVWLDYALLKQGEWRNNPITEDHVVEFLGKVSNGQWDGIPFPGIEAAKPIDPHGNNWRFCGSTHIWPVRYLRAIDKCYRVKLLQFMRCYDCTPLDLAIWPLVERDSGLPFKWYKAEYDATQLTNFPGDKS